MDKMTVDAAPTSGSANLVTSGGVYDAINTATQYVPTSAGTTGQVWTSDGAGAGVWKEPAGGGMELYTGSLSELFTVSSSYIEVLKNIDIVCHLDESYTMKGTDVLSIRKGKYSISTTGKLKLRKFLVYGSSSSDRAWLQIEISSGPTITVTTGSQTLPRSIRSSSSETRFYRIFA